MDFFLLLRLPLLALGTVLECMTPFEIIFLSQCSRKMANLIRMALRTRPKLSIDFSTNQIQVYNHFIYFMGIDVMKRDELVTRSFGNQTVQLILPSDRNPNSMNIVRNGHGRNHMAVLAIEVSKIFGTPFSGLLNVSFSGYQPLIEFIIENQSQIERLKIHVSEEDQKSFEDLRDAVHITEELWIEAGLTWNSNKDYRYKTREHEPKMLRFERAASLFNFQKLVESNYVRICLTDSNLTNKELDTYIRKWMNGDYPNLINLEVGGSPADKEDPIVGLAYPIVGDSGQTKRRQIGNYYYASITNGVEIQRNDGKATAWIRMAPRNNVADTREFSFLVFS